MYHGGFGLGARRSAFVEGGADFENLASAERRTPIEYAVLRYPEAC
jgi:hypothetical protein